MINVNGMRGELVINVNGMRGDFGRGMEVGIGYRKL